MTPEMAECITFFALLCFALLAEDWVEELLKRCVKLDWVKRHQPFRRLWLRWMKANFAQIMT